MKNRKAECEKNKKKLRALLLLAYNLEYIMVCINTRATHPSCHSLPLHMPIIPRPHTASVHHSILYYSCSPNSPHLFHTACSLSYFRFLHLPALWCISQRRSSATEDRRLRLDYIPLLPLRIRTVPELRYLYPVISIFIFWEVTWALPCNIAQKRVRLVVTLRHC